MLPLRLLTELESRVQSAAVAYWAVVVIALASLCPLAGSLMHLLVDFLDDLDPNILDNQPGKFEEEFFLKCYFAGLLLVFCALAWALAYYTQQRAVVARDLQDHGLLSSFADEQHELAVNELKLERSSRKVVTARPRRDLFDKLRHFAANYRDYKFLAGDRSIEPGHTYLEANLPLDFALSLLAFLSAFSFAGIAIVGPVLLRIMLIYPRQSAVMNAVVTELRRA